MKETMIVILFIWCMALSVFIIWKNSVQSDINNNLIQATKNVSEAAKMNTESIKFNTQAISILSKRR